MLQQQPGAVANQYRGSQAQPLQLQPSPVPGTAVRAVGQAPAQQAKHTRLASSKLPPSCAGAVDNAAANASTVSASINRAGGASGSAISVAGSCQAAVSSGMTWNPVRLMTPFEKASNASAGENLLCMDSCKPQVTALLCLGVARPLTYCICIVLHAFVQETLLALCFCLCATSADNSVSGCPFCSTMQNAMFH